MLHLPWPAAPPTPPHGCALTPACATLPLCNQIESMRAYARDAVAFLPAHLRARGTVADQLRDGFADDQLDGDMETAKRLWPKALAQLRNDSRVQVTERVDHGRQRMFM